jgi:hypothetical protein
VGVGDFELLAHALASPRRLAASTLVPVPGGAAALRAHPETLHGEPSEIWPFLGSDRLAAPILEHRPDLVLHGHAHAGLLQGELEGVPV